MVTLVKQYDRYEEAVSAVFEKFVAFDADHSSTLDYEETYAYFNEHGLFKGMPHAEIEKFMLKFFSGMDTDGNGELDFGEFMRAHSTLVRYRRDNCLPPIESLSMEKLVDACKRTKERLMQKQQAELKKAREEESSGKQDPEAKPRRAQKLATCVEHLARQHSTQLLKKAFVDVDYQKTGRVALEDFHEQMCKLGYIKDTASSFYASFARDHPMLAEVTFDIVLQIVFPNLSSIQRELLHERIKVPSTDPKDLLTPLQEAKHHRTKRLSRIKSLELSTDTRQSIFQIFKDGDDNEDDELDIDEFIDLMADVHTAEECENLFNAIDIDDSGTLNVWEFVAWWTTSQNYGRAHINDFKERLLDFAQSNYKPQDQVLEACLELQCAMAERNEKKGRVGYC